MLPARPIVFALALATLVSCALPVATTGNAPAAAKKSPAPHVSASGKPTQVPAVALKEVLAVVVSAPAGIISNNGSGLGGIITNGSGNWRIQGLTKEPLADTEVYIADPAGKRIASIPAVRTDSEGKAEFKDLPRNRTYIVVASVRTTSNKDAGLYSLARPGLKSSTAVNVASTLVTLSLLERANGQADAVDLDKFDRVSRMTDEKLDELPDLADRAAISNAFARLEGKIAELKDLVAELKAEIAEVTTSVDKLKQELADREKASPPASPSLPSPPTLPSPSIRPILTDPS